MESGLEDRNNWRYRRAFERDRQAAVSMESGLEDRNNANLQEHILTD